MHCIVVSFMSVKSINNKTVPRVFVISGNPHPFATTSGRSLDHNRIADLPRNLDAVIRVPDHSIKARNRVDAGRHRQPLRLQLVPHAGDRLRRRSHERHLLLLLFETYVKIFMRSLSECGRTSMPTKLAFSDRNP